MRNGSFTGTVYSAVGMAVQGATISVMTPGNDQVASATSDRNGKFSIPDVPPGVYNIVVQLANSTVKRIQGLRIEAGKSHSFDISIDVGGPRRGTRSTFTSPVWNIWTEHFQTDSPAFKPAKVRSGQSFLLVVDLSAMKYKTGDDGATYSHQISASFDQLLGQNSDDAATVQILAIPDERFFERTDTQRVRTMEVDLAKIRQTQKAGFTLSGSPFAYLARRGGMRRSALSITK